MIWEIIPKISDPAEIYTHHKALLCWCFKNKPINEFSFFVLKTWMEFTVHHDNQTFSQHSAETLKHLLCFNEIAQDCFVQQFNINPEISFSFLKSVLNFNINQEMNLNGKLQDLIEALMENIMGSLLKFLMIRYKEGENCNDKFLQIGLECLLWGNEIVCVVNTEMNIKLVFHVTNFCCRENVEKTSVCITCLKFLNYCVENSCEDSKNWHVVTGTKNLSSFLLKCFYVIKTFEVYALTLLVTILKHQVKATLQSSTHIMLPLTKILQWMNTEDTKVLALELINQLLETDFKSGFLQICSIETVASDGTLTRKDLRILVFYLQNTVVLGNPIVDKIAFSSYVKLMKYIAKTDVSLEQHLMLQPWLRVLLESKLEDINADTWFLFEESFNFHKENVSLIGVIKQFTEKVIHQDCTLNKDQIQSLKKLRNSTYRSYISSEILEKLDEIATTNNLISTNCQEKEVDLVSQVENIVTNFISNMDSSTNLESSNLTI